MEGAGVTLILIGFGVVAFILKNDIKANAISYWFNWCRKFDCHGTGWLRPADSK